MKHKITLADGSIIKKKVFKISSDFRNNANIRTKIRKYFEKLYPTSDRSSNGHSINNDHQIIIVDVLNKRFQFNANINNVLNFLTNDIIFYFDTYGLINVMVYVDDFTKLDTVKYSSHTIKIAEHKIECKLHKTISSHDSNPKKILDDWVKIHEFKHNAKNYNKNLNITLKYCNTTKFGSEFNELKKYVSLKTTTKYLLESCENTQFNISTEIYLRSGDWNVKTDKKNKVKFCGAFFTGTHILYYAINSFDTICITSPFNRTFTKLILPNLTKLRFNSISCTSNEFEQFLKNNPNLYSLDIFYLKRETHYKILENNTTVTHLILSTLNEKYLTELLHNTHTLESICIKSNVRITKKLSDSIQIFTCSAEIDFTTMINLIESKLCFIKSSINVTKDEISKLKDSYPDNIILAILLNSKNILTKNKTLQYILDCETIDVHKYNATL